MLRYGNFYARVLSSFFFIFFGGGGGGGGGDFENDQRFMVQIYGMAEGPA